MSDYRFYVDRDGYGEEKIFYGLGPDALHDNPDEVVARGWLDRQNLVLWRKVVHALTGEWPECDVAVCHHEDHRHEGGCVTNIGISFGGGGPDAA